MVPLTKESQILTAPKVNLKMNLLLNFGPTFISFLHPPPANLYDKKMWPDANSTCTRTSAYIYVCICICTCTHRYMYLVHT